MHNTDELLRLLRERYCPPAWAFIPQVRSGTGYVHSVRTADAIAMGLWPSRGLELHGFEVKADRGDWLSELKRPEKAEEIASFCDFWWVVAPKEIVEVHEVPMNWGLLVPRGKQLTAAKPAVKLQPEAVDRLFLAAILRKAQGIVTPEPVLQKKYDDGFEAGKTQADRNFKYEREQHEDLKKVVVMFEGKSGVRITNTWHGDAIGEAVRAVMDGEHLRQQDNLKRLLVTAKEVVTAIEEALKK